MARETVEKLQKELTEAKSKSSEAESFVNLPKELFSQLQNQLDEIKKNTERSVQNYKSADFLGPASLSDNENSCFIIMPYTQSWSEAVEKIITNVCSELSCKISIAKSMNGRFIPRDIWQGITSSSIIIADLTGSNPNVAYEVGLADAIGKNVILICQESNVPFDILGQRLIIYSDSIEGSQKLEKNLKIRMENFLCEHPSNTKYNKANSSDAKKSANDWQR